MKTLLLIIRWIVGLLFIFSGLVKANDPLGLSYKMQEFFEVWGLSGFNGFTLSLSLIMNVFEVVAGVAVIIGWRMKMFSWLLLLLIVFFTFLTGYALFSGKIKTCGCFGDCLPLTAAQSFGKDIFLLVLILILFAAHHKIASALKPALAVCLLLVVTAVTSLGQVHVLKHLPVVDCLPYKKGNDLLEQMKTPAGAIPDSMSIVFVYQKNDKQIEFDQTAFPADFDSTYIYVDRRDKVVRKGNGLQPKILDFSLQTLSGTDTTQAVLSQTAPYILLMAKDMDNAAAWAPGFEKVKALAKEKNLPLMIVTANSDKATELFPNIPVVKCDATVLKTAARVTPTYFVMKGAVVLDKNGFEDMEKITEGINHLK